MRASFENTTFLYGVQSRVEWIAIYDAAGHALYRHSDAGPRVGTNTHTGIAYTAHVSLLQLKKSREF